MRRAVWAPVIGVPVILLLALGFQHNPNATGSPVVNQPAPHFALTSLGGKRIVSADLKGKPVVLNFWASWCAECRTEHPDLLRAWRTFAPQGVTFVGIGYQDGKSAAQSWIRKYQAPWTQLTDPNQHTAIEFGVSGVPETYLIDRHGIIRFHSIGPVTWSVLNREIRRIMA
jgi:cytochrome c biogenesis protein CcmG/thiol:disulfide interchange protein DsbE